MAKTEQKIIALGNKRLTTGYLRMFLSRFVMQFHDFIISALNNIYYETNSIFFNGSDADFYLTRLRALMHRLNSKFSDYIKNNGQKRKIIDRHLKSDSESDIFSKNGQILVTETEMKEWIKEVYSVFFYF